MYITFSIRYCCTVVFLNVILVLSVSQFAFVNGCQIVLTKWMLKAKCLRLLKMAPGHTYTHERTNARTRTHDIQARTHKHVPTYYSNLVSAESIVFFKVSKVYTCMYISLNIFLFNVFVFFAYIVFLFTCLLIMLHVKWSLFDCCITCYSIIGGIKVKVKDRVCITFNQPNNTEHVFKFAFFL